MKRILACLVLLSVLALAQFLPQSQSAVSRLPAAVAGGKVWLIDENCEGASTPSGWTNHNTVDWDYSTAGLDLDGSHCLHIAVSATVGQAVTSFGSRTDVWLFWKLYIAGRPTSSAIMIEVMNANETSTLAYVQLRSTGGFRVYNGTTYLSPVSVIAATADTYWFWLHLRTTGDGAGVLTEFAFSPTSTKPTSGDNYVTGVTGDNATAMVLARWSGNNQGQDMYFDKLRGDDEVIGDNGE